MTLIAQLVVYDVDIEADLPGVLRSELAELELEHDVAVGGNMEEEHVEEELLAPYLERHLATDESKASAELDHEALDLGNERAL